MNQLHNPGSPVTLNVAGLEITGFAISALASYVLVPSYDAIFDIGHCPKEALPLRYVFLSHVHHDHVGGLYRYLSLRQMRGMPPPYVAVPEQSADDLVAWIEASARLERSDPPAFLLQRMAPGDALSLNGKLSVRCFDVDHVLPSLGYSVVSTRRVLRPDLHGKAGPELRAMKAQGVTIDESRETDEFVYIGDSTVETLLKHNDWLCHAKRVMLECTHFGDVDEHLSAKVYGHTPLSSLTTMRMYQTVFGGPEVVLKHFSMRYARDQILAIRDEFHEVVQRRLHFLV